ncbi:MAG: hypothetical protein U0872_16465 [Planctomycetaceae bacterium]
MRPEAGFILFLLALVPIGWICSEFGNNRFLRISLGAISLVMICGLSILGTNVYNRFNYNAWYGFAAKELFHTIVVQIEDGKTDRVLSALKQLDEEFSPTYENRANYDELVAQAVKQMQDAAEGGNR